MEQQALNDAQVRYLLNRCLQLERRWNPGARGGWILGFPQYKDALNKIIYQSCENNRWYLWMKPYWKDTFIERYGVPENFVWWDIWRA